MSQLAAAAETIDAMAAGADVIFQATFFDGTLAGHADFLLRMDDAARPSRFGAYHYEVADTKLARHVKASAVLQICSYIDQLDRAAGRRTRSGCMSPWAAARRDAPTLRVDDYMAYYRRPATGSCGHGRRSRPSPSRRAATYPEPVDHCDVCRWAVECVARRSDDDHLVTGRRDHRPPTPGPCGRAVDDARGARRPAPCPSPRSWTATSVAALTRVREQARLQLEGRREGRLKYELLLPPPGEPVEPERGLASLPEPSPATCSSTSRATPSRSTMASTTCSACSRSRATSTPSGRATRGSGAFTLDGERAAFEQLIDLSDRAPGGGTRRCTSITTPPTSRPRSSG